MINTLWINEIIGTSLQGYVESSFDNLVHFLGAPHYRKGHDKIDAEWRLKFADGTIATVYNYKDGTNYLNEKGMAVEDITNWHIGGFSKKAYFKISDLVLSKRIDLN